MLLNIFLGIFVLFFFSISDCNQQKLLIIARNLHIEKGFSRIFACSQEITKFIKNIRYPVFVQFMRIGTVDSLPLRYVKKQREVPICPDVCSFLQLNQFRNSMGKI